jgi:hypothetical protein
MERIMQEMNAMNLNPIFREAAMRDPMIAAALGLYEAPAHIVEDKKNYPSPEYIFSSIPNSEGYILKIIRQMSGTWNGYVTIPETHPYAKKFYDQLNDQVPYPPIELTYGGPGRKNDKFGVEFGFDHNHMGDTDEKWYANYDTVRQEVIDLFLFFKMAEGVVDSTSNSGGGNVGGGGGGGGGSDTDPIDSKSNSGDSDDRGVDFFPI